MLSFALSPEQQMLVETARRFAREEILPVAAECDRESKFPHDVYRKAHEIGLTVPEIPADYDGSGMGVAMMSSKAKPPLYTRASAHPWMQSGFVARTLPMYSSAIPSGCVKVKLSR